MQEEGKTIKKDLRTLWNFTAWMAFLSLPFGTNAKTVVEKQEINVELQPVHAIDGGLRLV